MRGASAGPETGEVAVRRDPLASRTRPRGPRTRRPERGCRSPSLSRRGLRRSRSDAHPAGRRCSAAAPAARARKQPRPPGGSARRRSVVGRDPGDRAEHLGRHPVSLVAVHHALEPRAVAVVVDAVVAEGVEQDVDVRQDQRRRSMTSRRAALSSRSIPCRVPLPHVRRGSRRGTLGAASRGWRARDAARARSRTSGSVLGDPPRASPAPGAHHPAERWSAYV